ncbi:lipoprotein-anchoring transpeptidase ErfK/SrfK [Kitasatospora kifunensis]|uniref:Lipoprotein-anchoring transpeptidase ErfK/SrfK n=2 Tax=Kitasatospora kifunensis TaxID=58351 RepID=A0A7W7VUW8_KITKI|nr:Ig-like domain-containing protein [Kitasatospora kifunensis]MBB4922905.1 lipoprotein-anchoring transpeptidase ErfK/SrfK [Kitasatospora kifunensis]
MAVTPLMAGPLTACSGTSGPPRAVDAAHLVHSSAADAEPGKPFTVSADSGNRVTDVTLSGPDGRLLAGTLDPDGRGWHSATALAPATHYTARISAVNAGGGRGETTQDFTTKAAERLLSASLGPDLGRKVYGVGEPLTVKLSEEVKDPAARQRVESALTVASDPAVIGSWYWVDGQNLHFRPKDYWPANTKVKLTYDADGKQIDGGLYGGPGVSLSFSTGDRVEALVDAASDRLTLKRNGEVVTTLPVTTGRPGFDTRNGIKVVLSQEREVQMRSETIGIAKGSTDAFDLKVEWATRVTWSGEYVHAAPWSVSSQGVENVSHGCTGMSTENAKWFFNQVRVGDIVEVVNSKGHPMEPFGNGFGDWNVSWDQWLKGSALGQPLSTGAAPQVPQAAATLRPQV